ncbi:MAG: pyrroline-5-carboxylate reductase [Arenicellales bacterium]
MSNPDRPIVAFIGGGNMSSSIIGGLIKSGWPTEKIRVSDPVAEQRQKLITQYSIYCFEENGACVDGAEVVVLGVKPQMLKEAVASIADQLSEQTPLLVSIAAGIPSDSIISWIGRELPFIRVMPNTPALVNCGVSGLFANSLTTKPQRQLAESLMHAVGEVIWVNDENLIDTVTGVSGSGPAYFFKMMELMIAEGIANGLTPAAAKSLVIETARGAASLIRSSSLEPAELRHQVTSPGGTTEAGIRYMEQAGIDDAIRGGVKAAILRSSELSRQFGGN